MGKEDVISVSQYAHTMEYYSDIKNEVMPCSKHMDLEIIILSMISKPKTNIMILLQSEAIKKYK